MTLSLYTLAVKPEMNRNDPAVSVHKSRKDALETLRTNFDEDYEFDGPLESDEDVERFGRFFMLSIALDTHDILDSLFHFEVRQQADEDGESTDKIDPELVCTICSTTLCDIEVDDSLYSLVSTALNHDIQEGHLS